MQRHLPQEHFRFNQDLDHHEVSFPPLHCLNYANFLKFSLLLDNVSLLTWMIEAQTSTF